MLSILRIAVIAAVINPVFVAGQAPPFYPSTSRPNSVRIWSANVAQSDNSKIVASTTVDSFSQSTTYHDGLGRLIQTVGKQQSPSRNDIVTPQFYDDFGRERYRFLPFQSVVATVGDITNDGNMKANPFVQQDQFYDQYLSGQSQTHYYGRADFEPSPLNRMAKILPEGSNWAGANRGVTIYNYVNVANEVRLLTVSATAGNVPLSSGDYTAGELYRTISTDEHGKNTIEYKNKDGQLILKKVEVKMDGQASFNSHTGWLSTYYIYDDLNNLRWVLPPLAVEKLIGAGWNFGGANYTASVIANELCFYYEYDDQNRMIIKKVPGAGIEEMVYDKRDRLIMSRHAKLAEQGYWQVNKYDAQNRLIKIGLIANASSRTVHQTSANADLNYPTLNNADVMQENYYDDYNWASVLGPAATMHTGDIWSAYFFTTFNAAPEYAQPVVADLVNLRDKVTGMKVRVLGTGTYLYTINWYDEKGRVIQTRSTNISGAYDRYTTQYDFAGRPLRVLHVNEKWGGPARFTKELTKYTYDHAGRVLAVKKKVSHNGSDVNIATNTYNELGRLKTKMVGNNLETQSFEYNVRGWVFGMNRDFIRKTATNFFAYELGFDQNAMATPGSTFGIPLYNGNIGALVWRGSADKEVRHFEFKYDPANRLLSADFNQHTNGWFNKQAGLDYSIDTIRYDANGNITDMNQKATVVGVTGYLDQMDYAYLANSNKLARVKDVSTNTKKLGDFKDGMNVDDDYTYDVNGRLIADKNKGITSILYTHLNQPYEINIAGKGKITYTYDNLGNKLKKVVLDTEANPDITTTYQYTQNFVYKNDTLQFFTHEEGRARYDQTQTAAETKIFNYDYFLKDHLGNVRVVVTEEKDTSSYFATMELAARTKEEQLFSNIAASVYPKASVAGYPADATTNPNDYIVRLNGNGQKVGPTLVLKVMTGDKIDVAAKSFYKSPLSTPATTTPVGDILTSIATGLIGIAGDSKGTLGELTNSSSGPLLNAVNDFRTAHNPSQSNKPKAYLNWMLLDEQLKPVTTYPSSGAIPVGGADLLNTLALSGLIIPRSGYLCIYVSNESNGWDVYFDNLSVTHYTGPLIEETHYYPFGLTMPGISTQALGTIENKRGFAGNELQNKEFSDGSGIEMYDFNARTYYQQIGRFIQIDPLLEKDQEYITPYHYSFNNPIRFSDADGKEAVQCCGWSDFVDAVNTVTRSTTVAVSAAVNAWSSNQIGGVGRVDVSTQSGLTDGDRIAAQVGQQIGDVVSIITGALEVAGGTYTEVQTGGAATALAVPVIAHGASSIALGMKNLVNGKPKEKSDEGSQRRSDSQDGKQTGSTAGGGKTDEFGNKLGPSGKPQVNKVEHPTRKKAKDAARNEGQGAPENHTNPNKGKQHYHATDREGNKKPNSTHHEYPE
jgi:RHS repeat-associated protein